MNSGGIEMQVPGPKSQDGARGKKQDAKSKTTAFRCFLLLYFFLSLVPRHTSQDFTAACFLPTFFLRVSASPFRRVLEWSVVYGLRSNE